MTSRVYEGTNRVLRFQATMIKILSKKAEYPTGVVNYSKTITYPLKVKTIDNRIAESIYIYTTSARADENLKLSVQDNQEDILSVSPRSVVTVVMEFR